ncbi:MAG TPA: J domain-containing protein [Chthoniobacteraceae bacterium]|nr:J domain-containing protein [Chthoniobacteraceae bacterium]
MNHYQTLGVSPSASAEEIKVAHRKLARRHHPDAGGDATLFQAIQAAAEVLGDPEKRRDYDHALRNQPVESLPQAAAEVVREYIGSC